MKAIWKKAAAVLCCMVLLCGAGCTQQSQNSSSSKTAASTSSQEASSKAAVSTDSPESSSKTTVTSNQESDSGDKTVVSTAYGKVQGSVSDQIVAFKGIPFAKPPVGELRFAPPEEPEAWEGVLECKTLKPIPPQSRGEGVSGEEDCLYLNIWVPEKALENKTQEKLPVLVFIHGGAFAVGAAADPMYDGTAFAKDDVICVTVEYRLNMPGFLTSQVLEAEYGYLGNLGLLDQIASLQWVKNNIQSFGGDSNRITISGESAGAMSVSSLMASPLAEGLFQQAIMESGSVFTQPIVDPKCGGDKETSLSRSAQLMDALGATDLESLRRLEINDMVEKSAFSMDMTKQNPFCQMPVYDGNILPTNPYGNVQKGEFQDLPVLMGYNTDEGTTFIPQDTTEESYIQFVQDIFGDQAETVLAQYPVDELHSAADRARALVKMSFQLGCQIYGDALDQLGKAAYVYNFDYHIPEYDAAGMGAKHGLELPFVFDTFPQGTVLPEDGPAMIEQIHQYWVSFIKTGNPNDKASASPEWPAYTAQEKSILQINAQWQTIPLENQEDIAFYIDLLFAE